MAGFVNVWCVTILHHYFSFYLTLSIFVVTLQELGEGAVKGEGETGGVYQRVNRELKKVCTHRPALPLTGSGGWDVLRPERVKLKICPSICLWVHFPGNG